MIYFFMFLMANANYDEQIVKLSELRQKVENLSIKRQSDQKQKNLELESLMGRKAELEQLLSRERLKNQIAINKNNLNQKMGQVQKQNQNDQRWIKKWIEELKQYVQVGLPYQQEKRLKSVDLISQRLESQESHEVLVQDLWKLTENELELTRTNTFELGSLKISDDEETAEIVKLGMLKLFFKTAKGKRGFAKLENNQWSLQVLDDEKLIHAVDQILSQVQQQKGSALLSFPKEIL